MPYKNKGKVKRTTKSYKKSNGLSPAKIQNLIKKTIYKTAETKMFPVETTISEGATSADVKNFSLVATQGTDNEQRIGDVINGIGMDFRMILQNNSAKDYWIRFVIVRANRSEFTSNTDLWLLNTSNEPITITNDDDTNIIQSVNKKQLSVMYDKVIRLAPLDTTTTGQGAKGTYFFKKFFKFNHKRVFPFDASNAGESERDNIRMLIFVRPGGSTASSAGDITGETMTRYYFKDV